MSDRASAPRFGRWRALGRLLPSSVRERVFEPAFADLLREALQPDVDRTRHTPFALRAMGTYVGCVPPSVVQLFVVGGKLTRFSRVVGVVAVVGIAVRLVSVLMGDLYATTP